MRLFLDANILFTAAHRPEGKSALILKAVPKLCSTCSLAVEEARKNLELKAPEALPALERITRGILVLPTHLAGPGGQELPEKDRPIYWTALGCKATCLLTGDLKHFGPLMGKPVDGHGMRVMTVADFLESLK
jgi:predicted nucleic acid-binding protein